MTQQTIPLDEPRDCCASGADLFRAGYRHGIASASAILQNHCHKLPKTVLIPVQQWLLERAEIDACDVCTSDGTIRDDRDRSVPHSHGGGSLADRYRALADHLDQEAS